jgi:4-amino-4-deoxy-L-arabinose transferase-like glycosyltransferase
VRKAIIFVLSLVAVRLAVAWVYPLLPDEAYYWVWSRQPAAGYFDHPPMVAWLIRGGTLLLGNSELGVRLPFVLLSCATSLLVFLLIRDLSGHRNAFHGLLAGSAALLLGVGGLLAVPDVPLLFFWALGLLAGIRALKRGSWWVIYGVALGGALLSKYTAVFLLTLPAAYLFRERKALRTGFLGLGLSLAFLLFLPNIIWNATHGWVSLFYQAGHGLGKAWKPSGLLKYIIDAVLVNSLFLFGFLVWGALRGIKRPPDPARLALALSFWVPFLFFWAASAKGSAEANWPAPAYMSLVILGVAGLRESTKGWAWKASVAFGLALVGLVYAQAIRPFLHLKGDPTANARGWRELAYCVQELRKGYPNLILAAPRYQEAAELSFYLPGNPLVKVANPRGRPNQITLTHPAYPGESFLFVGEPVGFSETEKVFEFRGQRPYNVYIAKGYLCTR